MRRLLLFAWLLLPVAAGAYHYGPGQVALRTDAAASAAERADALASDARAIAAKGGDDAARATWGRAVEAYGEALAALPPGHDAEGRALRLELAKARMFVSQLPEAHRDLIALVEELESLPDANAAQAAEARAALANAQYYRTWLMRLEGAPREEWEPEIEAARQNYRLVAETAAARGDTQVAQATEQDLESAVRLARMELSDLQGLPLPSQ